MSHTTLTRFLNDRTNDRSISPSTFRKIEQASGIPAGPFIEGDSLPLKYDIYPHPKQPIYDRAGRLLGSSISVPYGKGRTVRFRDDGTADTFLDPLYSESDRWGIGPLASLAKLRGTIGSSGNVCVDCKPENFLYSSIILPFDPHDGASAYLIDTDSLQPRYERGDALIFWGSPRLLDGEEIVEGILWSEDNSALFGKISAEQNLYDVDIIGSKPLRNRPGHEVSVLNAVVRKNQYQGTSKAL